ncbi:MAG: ATP-binding cassette domain-containing protein [Neisseriaceae bacterium]|nr:MAG: ATP-binding cassette domain-containing protein [Neisseriaceae bacterium]
MSNIINAENMQFAIGHFDLLNHANFSLTQNEKVGLIGRNGVGKSSFLKILAGKEELDSGTLHIQRDFKVVYVAQEAHFNPESTIFETVSEGLGALKDILKTYHTQSIMVANKPDDLSLLENLNQLQLELENHNGWVLDTLIQQTLAQLELPKDELIKNLSGGEKKCVQLAQAWVQNPDILLLDEPTNHLDIDTIIWLENLLLEFKGSIVVITHDRRFLDRVVTRIVELDRGRLTSYSGSFKQYQEKKRQEIAIEIEHNHLFDKFHAQEEAWIRKGIEARRTRNEGRVRRLEELRKQKQARREIQGQVNLTISEACKSGKIIVELENITFAYPNKAPVIQNYNGIIQRGDKIGLIGSNGVGKTTFLKLILDELQPTSGLIKRGSKQKVAYFDQFRNQLNNSDTVFEALGQGNDTVTINGKNKHVMSYLEDFLFHPSRANSPVASLSGGEKNRLLLAKLFTQPANILILDEPTNDLDIQTQELLEQLIRDFSGTVFLVSHDRELLENVITQSIIFEGNGILSNYIGGCYEDYQLTKKQNHENNQIVTQNNPKQNDIRTIATKKTPTKLSFNEKRELESLPKEIEALEKEQNQLNESLLQPDIFKTQYQKAIEWQKRINEIEELLMDKLNRWETLETKQQKCSH